jgi:hypothetical protein
MFKTSIKTEILHHYQLVIGIYSRDGAGLFNLFATFLTVGEPAPTGLLKIVQKLN